MRFKEYLTVNERVTEVEPMINMYQKSKDYGVPFGIRVHYSSGQSKSYAGNPENALANELNKKQRKYVEKLIKDIKAKKKIMGEALTVRSITDDVPRDFISKVRANQGLRNKINKDLHKIMKPTYFNSIPLKDIFNMLDKHGIVVLQEDQTEWSGFLTGGVKQTEQIIFHLGWKETKGQDKRYQVISNMALNLSYFKMPSGKFEVLAYVS